MNVIEGKAPFADFGTTFGTGLSSGLQSLANMKLNDITQQKQQAKASQFWKNAGLEGLGLEYQPESIQKSILDRLEGLNLGGQQQQPGMLNQLTGQPAEAQGGIKIGANPAERRHKETLQAQEKANAIKAESKLKAAEKEEQTHTLDKLQPFITKHSEDYKVQKQIKKLASSMLENLEKNKEKFPGALSGNLPQWTRTDPDVKKYEADLNKMILISGNARKGQLTNYKAKLEEAGKAGLNNPYDTKVAILKDFINDSEQVDQTENDIQAIKKANGGKWPRDLELQLIQRQQARQDPLNHPDQYTEGTIWDDPEGVEPSQMIVNGKWEII